jgi:hypothetical protein
VLSAPVNDCIELSPATLVCAAVAAAPTAAAAAAACADTAIKDNMLFSGLPPAGLAAIIDSMQPQMVTAGKEIIKQVCTLLQPPAVKYSVLL